MVGARGRPEAKGQTPPTGGRSASRRMRALPPCDEAVCILALELFGKDSDAGRDWGQEEKGMTEDEMAGWHH